LRATRFHWLRNSPYSKPTTDLYFINVLRDVIDDGLLSGRVRPLGMNSFAVDDMALVVRQENPRTIERILRHRWERLIYVVDDDIEAGMNDPGLLPIYRQRLSAQFSQCFVPMTRVADCIVTGSDALAERFGDRASTVAIDPVWHIDPAVRESAESDASIIRIIHAGAISHAADLEFILPAIERVLKCHRDVQFVTFLDTPAVRSLSSRCRVEIKPMRGWHWYRNWVGTEQYDVALYPVLDTPFNQARSVNKLIEHALLGAVGVYSASWCHSEKLIPGHNGFVAENRLDSWCSVLEEVIAQRDLLRSRFEAAVKLASRLNSGERQTALWRDKLAI
jgi:hypothetical protein